MRAKILFSNDLVCFTTRQFAIRNKQSLPAASRTLHRFMRRKSLVRVTKGIWANTNHPYFSVLGVVPILLGSEQGYVSFLTALHLHGALSQIPARTQIATTGHARIIKSPIGVFEFFSLAPHMMTTGIEWSSARIPYRIATPEKALFDTIYLSTRKGKRLQDIPELDYRFKKSQMRLFLRTQLKSKAIRVALEKKLGLYCSAFRA